jgi:rhamnulokinase
MAKQKQAKTKSKKKVETQKTKTATPPPPAPQRKGGKKKAFMALDLGAESGRVVAGLFDGERLTLKEVARFPNLPVRLHDGLHWDALRLFSEMKNGLAQAKNLGCEVASLGVDTWGVDFGLLDKQGALLGNPFHYRDSRTDGMMERAFSLVPKEEIYEQTGIQFMFLNTLYQLLSLAAANSPQLAIADKLLFTPDLFSYWFTGKKANEYTIASTSQCLNVQSRNWATPLLQRLGIPTHIFAEIVQPGAILGQLRPEIAAETGIGAANVITPGGHDTACAVAAVPAREQNFAYLSSGTWSLIGVESKQPFNNARSLECGFTNEGGVCGNILLLRNIAGLWVVQECQRAWAAQGHKYSYADLAALASRAKPLTAVLNLDDPAFLQTGDMPARIKEHCRRSGQKAPSDPGTFIRVALESLALEYRRSFEHLEELTGRQLQVLHIVGGGTQNQLLNQLAADAVGRPVLTGPIEATAAGSVLMQMLAQGYIKDLAEGRAIVTRSFETQSYEPRRAAAWDEAYEKLQKLS